MKTQLITKSEYARRRGVAPSAVTRAIAEGRITPIVVDGREMIEPIAADAQWAANSRRRTGSSPAVPVRSGSVAPGATYEAARRVREEAEAQLAVLRLQEQRGELIRVDAVRHAVARRLSTLRERFLGIPDRVATGLAATTDPVAVHQILEDEIRGALSLVADGDLLNSQEGSHA